MQQFKAATCGRTTAQHCFLREIDVTNNILSHQKERATGWYYAVMRLCSLDAMCSIVGYKHFSNWRIWLLQTGGICYAWIITAAYHWDQLDHIHPQYSWRNWLSHHLMNSFMNLYASARQLAALKMTIHCFPLYHNPQYLLPCTLLLHFACYRAQSRSVFNNQSLLYLPFSSVICQKKNIGNVNKCTADTDSHSLTINDSSSYWDLLRRCERLKAFRVKRELPQSWLPKVTNSEYKCS